MAALATLPFLAEASPEAIALGSQAVSNAIKLAPSALRAFEKYAPKIRKIPRFVSHFTKNPIQSLKSISPTELMKEAHDLTSDIGRGATHLENLVGKHHLLTKAQTLPSHASDLLNKSAKLSQALSGFFS